MQHCTAILRAVNLRHDGVFPGALVTLCQVMVIHGHVVKKVKFKIVGLCGVTHVFRSDFRQERKK